MILFSWKMRLSALLASIFTVTLETPLLVGVFPVISFIKVLSRFILAPSSYIFTTLV